MKVRVPISGTVGKSVQFDPEAGTRAEAAVAALAAQISAGIGGSIFHKSLKNLQVGDDHPQYAMWQAPETIQGLWDFATIPLIQGDTLAEYIEDVVGGSFFDFLQDTTSVVWTYHETANELEANVPPEFVQDTVGAMLVDSTSIDFTYDDPAGTFTASTINANPTGTIGLAAVNGTAATPMRSDAAPALSQAITPTWTNTHTFNNTPVVPNDSWAYAKIQNVSATSRVLGRISSGAGDIEELTSANLVTILGSSIPSGANPTASVGLSAVNGSASTFMRSDGAPALSESITPNWTNNHTWADNTEVRLGSGGDFRLYHDGSNNFLRADTGDFRLYVGANLVNRIGDGYQLIVTSAARPSIGLLTFNDPSGQKGYFGYDGSNQFDVWNNLNAALRFGTNNQEVLRLTATRHAQLAFDNSELQIGASQDLRLFHDGTDSWVRNDTGILKLAAGAASVFEVTAARGTFNVPYRSQAYTVATLPAGAQGDRAHVTDALAPVFLGIIAGGGAVVTPVFYNGTNWVAE